MSDLPSFSVINEKVKKVQDQEKIDEIGLAFEIFCLRTLFGLNDDEISEAITDGSMDGEVDAIYIINRDVNIITFKYTDNFEISKRNYPERELDQFILTVDSIIGGNLDKNTVNSAVWEKYEEIKHLHTSGRVVIKVYVISNKEYPITHAKQKLINIMQKYRIEEPIFYNQEDIVGIILDKKTEKVDGQIQFIDRQYFEKSNGNIQTLIGAISARDLVDLILDKENSQRINEQVFNENVRVYKENHRVNKAIINTAIGEANYQFFYLNNGITILCDHIDYSPNTRSPRVEIDNFQIINGGQTSHSLFEVYLSEPEKLDTIELLIRICKADHEDPISQKISETTNNQIPIGNRDLHSNDLIQKKLQEEFLELGYYYECKPNQYSDYSKEKIINNEMLGQLFMAYHLDMASEAKNNKVKVFSDLYDQIFDENVICASELLRLFNLYQPLLDWKRNIQRKKRQKEQVDKKEDFISRSTFHILNGTKFLFNNEIKNIRDQNISEQEKQIQINEMFSIKKDEIIQKSINMVYEVVKIEITKRGESYSHDKFFKETSTNDIIRNHFLKNIH